MKNSALTKNPELHLCQFQYWQVFIDVGAYYRIRYFIYYNFSVFEKF